MHMTKLGYTMEYKIETMARAYGRDLPLAWKKSIELARQLRGKTVESAREYLERVIALKQAVPMRTYNRCRPQGRHRTGPVPGEGGQGLPPDPGERGRERGVHGEGRSGHDGDPRDQRAQGSRVEGLSPAGLRTEQPVEPGHRESRDRTRRGGVGGGGEGRAQGQTHHRRERATGPAQGIPHERDT